MSSESSSESDVSSGLKRAFDRFRGHDRTLVEPARAAHAAAGRQADADELIRARHRIASRSVVRQDGLEAWPLPGLAPMTRVRTGFGDVPAAALWKGDEVLTRDGGLMPIKWLNRVFLDEHVLAEKPDSNPIVIDAGALGRMLPTAEIMVSPRQIVAADHLNGLTRDSEAAALISRPGVRCLRETCLSYTMFHLGETAEVCCEGLYLRFPLAA